MEFPSAGKNCAQSSCKQLDFLPFECECGLVFCSEHFSSHSQDCKTNKLLPQNELNMIKDVFICSHTDCTERSIIPLICESCQKHFCIKHRHYTECQQKSPESLANELEKYRKPVEQFNEAKKVVDQQIVAALEDAKKKKNRSEMANKVQLMKIKNKAVGLKTIPPINRVYFNVSYFDSNTVEKVNAIFVSNQWTVGRAIDAIAQEMKLKNNNNKLNEKKLKLFSKEDGEIISSNMSTLLTDLLKSKVIVDGGSLVIQYVDESCIKI